MRQKKGGVLLHTLLLGRRLLQTDHIKTTFTILADALGAAVWLGNMPAQIRFVRMVKMMDTAVLRGLND